MIASIEKIFQPAAREFLNHLHREFNPRRVQLLEKRVVIQNMLNQGKKPHFLKETEGIRADPSWKVAHVPQDLQRRWVEITGPVERKMMINAFNSGADTFMADFEDALSPTWSHVIEGQKNLFDAVRKDLEYTSKEGKVYRLEEKHATLMVRPRGWHLVEKHFEVEGEAISASLFDFGLFFFHNAHLLLDGNSGPYFYLPKLENREEAALWADVFAFAESFLHIPKRSIKATVLIETILAAFEMEEILFALKDYAVGLNAGRWDYIFSVIKKFAFDENLIFPDRSMITMATPFLSAYANLLVASCHKRGAHAIGGMAAFIPSRKDPLLNQQAFEKIEEDKEREASQGFDGTWVAHPDLVGKAREIFEKKLQGLDHQKKVIPEHTIQADDLLNFDIPQGKITVQGIKHNISVTLQYLMAWFNGLGAVAIFNLMEDTATAEISRAQLWQWIHHKALTDQGTSIEWTMIDELIHQEMERLTASKEMQMAVNLLLELVKREAFTDFLTLEAYQLLSNEVET